MSQVLVNKLMELGRRRRGFRCSPADALIIVLCIVGTLLLLPVLGAIVYVAPITLGHFFLFCNVVRMRRSYELIWAAVFALNVVAWTSLAELSWPWVLITQTPVTCVLVLCECRSGDYHGVFCRREPHIVAARENICDLPQSQDDE